LLTMELKSCIISRSNTSAAYACILCLVMVVHYLFKHTVISCKSYIFASAFKTKGVIFCFILI
jgi:hypothetical protein